MTAHPMALAAAVCVLLAQTGGPPQPKGPQPFGPGILSVGEVYRGSFSPDGRTFYFFRKLGEGEIYGIFSSTLSADAWSTPVRVRLGGEFSDLYPSISADGHRIVFSSYRPVPGITTDKPNAHLWYADWENDRWGTPVFIARASTRGHYHSWVNIGFDGALYFRRTSPDWKTTETWRSRWNGREYGDPELYADVERWKTWRADVTVAGGVPGPDGATIFLDIATRNPATGQPASDIWVAQRRGAGWIAPRPLGAGINSDGFDVFPFFSPDGRDLYFVRDFTTFYRIPLAEALASLEAVAERRETSPAADR